MSFLSSCAFGTRQVALTYPQPAKLSAPSKSSDRVIFFEFQDQRQDPSKVGDVQNGYTMKTAKVVANSDVRKWVNDAIRSQLEQFGYQVTIGHTDEDKKAGLVLSGAILNVYCTAYWTYEGEIYLTATIKKNGGKLIDKPYYASRKEIINWAATSKSFGKILALTLSDVVGQLVSDLDNLNNNGAPAPT